MNSDATTKGLNHLKFMCRSITVFLSSVLISLFPTVAGAETAPNFRWAQQSLGNYWKRGESLAVDTAGNVFATGSCQADISFSGTTLTHGGFFVTKHDKSGNLVWAKQDGLPYPSCESDEIAVDTNGNVFVAGSFLPYYDFPIVIGGVTLVSRGQGDTFVAKYNSEGNPV